MTTDKIDYTKKFIDLPDPLRYLEEKDVFDQEGYPQTEKLREHFLKEGRILPKQAIEIIKQASKIFESEPNLIFIKDPITVVGDIHGQFYDLNKLLTISGHPSTTSYIFLGDFVDRGCFGMEVLLLLLAYKIHFPETFIMLRGNHESRHIASFFNFKQECLFKYNQEVWEACCGLFNALPLACILNNRFLCVHGGISPSIETLSDIQEIDRFQEVPSSGGFCDLLWSDPTEDEEIDDDMFVYNEQRNCSYCFTHKAVTEFLGHNGLLSIIRGHEIQEEGFKLYKNGNETGFPSVICVFSAPNYCDSYGNMGAIITFNKNEMNIRQFKAVDHPYYLPKFMNVFQWSIPYVSEKISDLFKCIIKKCDEDEDEEFTPEKRELIKTKIMTLGRMSKLYETLRKEQETILLLKQLTGGTIPKGLLSEGPDAIKDALKNYQTIKKIDAINEQRPDVELSPVSPILKKSESFKGKLKPVENYSSLESPKIQILKK